MEHTTDTPNAEQTSGNALLINPDGEVKEVPLPPADASALPIFYREMDCYGVECVDMWIDGNGFEVADYNHTATLLARRFGKTHQPYYGPVMITVHDGTGGTVGMTDERMLGLLQTLLDISDQ